QGSELHPIDQALLVLDSCCPEHTHEEHVNLNLGQRDVRLVDVHRRTFGDGLDAYTECPKCQERLEFSLSYEILSPYGSPNQVTSKTVTIQGRDFTLRCLNSRDAAAAAVSENAEAAKKILLSLCAAPAIGSIESIDPLPQTTEDLIEA